jgi:hypothetical protein
MSDYLIVPVNDDAYRLPENYFISVSGGFKASEATLVIMITTVASINQLTWDYPYLVILYVVIAILFMWQLRKINKDGRSLTVWARDVFKFYFHTHILHRRAMVGGNAFYPPARVKRINQMTLFVLTPREEARLCQAKSKRERNARRSFARRRAS